MTAERWNVTNPHLTPAERLAAAIEWARRLDAGRDRAAAASAWGHVRRLKAEARTAG